MYLIYIDDSRDEQYCVFSALAVPAESWQSAFHQIKNFRHNLKKRHGIYVHVEFHAWKFISGRGKISDQVITKGKRCQIFKDTLKLITSLPGVRLFTVVFPAKKELQAFESLLNNISHSMEKWNSYAIIICDEGKESTYTRLVRKLYQYNINGDKKIQNEIKANSLPKGRILEDPFFKKSEQSYFIQLVDFCAYALLRKVNPIPSKIKYGLHQAFNILSTILVKGNSG